MQTAGIRASVSEILLMALEPVSCLLPLVCLIVCLPSKPVCLPSDPQRCTSLRLSAALLTCLSSCSFFVCLDGEVCNGHHSIQLQGGGDRTNDRIYVLPNKVYKWTLVSRNPTASFHIGQGFGDQLQGPVMHIQLVAAKK